MLDEEYRKRLDKILGSMAVKGYGKPEMQTVVDDFKSIYDPDARIDESEFRAWYQDEAIRNNLSPDPDDPKHFYNYRAAFRSGAEPDETGHWPSKFKREGHPDLIIDGIDTRTNEPPDWDMFQNPTSYFEQYQQTGLAPKRSAQVTGAPTQTAEVPVENVRTEQMQLTSPAKQPEIMPPAEIKPAAEFGAGAIMGASKMDLKNMIASNIKGAARSVGGDLAEPNPVLFNRGKQLVESNTKPEAPEDKQAVQYYTLHKRGTEWSAAAEPVKKAMMDYADEIEKTIPEKDKQTVQDAQDWLTTREAALPQNYPRTAAAIAVVSAANGSSNLMALAGAIPVVGAPAAAAGAASLVNRERESWIDNARAAGLDDEKLLETFGNFYAVPSGVVEYGSSAVMTGPLRALAKSKKFAPFLAKATTNAAKKSILKSVIGQVLGTAGAVATEGAEEFTQQEMQDGVLWWALTEAAKQHPEKADQYIEQRDKINLPQTTTDAWKSFIVGAAAALPVTLVSRLAGGVGKRMQNREAPETTAPVTEQPAPPPVPPAPTAKVVKKTGDITQTYVPGEQGAIETGKQTTTPEPATLSKTQENVMEGRLRRADEMVTKAKGLLGDQVTTKEQLFGYADALKTKLNVASFEELKGLDDAALGEKLSKLNDKEQAFVETMPLDELDAYALLPAQPQETPNVQQEEKGVQVAPPQKKEKAGEASLIPENPSDEEISRFTPEQKDVYLRQLKGEIATDQLTGLMSRRGASAKKYMHMEETTENGEKVYEPVWDKRPDGSSDMIVLDIDNFGKGVNNYFGHRTGDRVLTRTGGLLSDKLQGLADVVRYGGEEIAIIPLPNADRNSILNKVEEARDLLHQQVFKSGDEELSGVTFSAGYGKDFEDADSQLYKAKESGKARTFSEGKQYAENDLQPTPLREPRRRAEDTAGGAGGTGRVLPAAETTSPAPAQEITPQKKEQPQEVAPPAEPSPKAIFNELGKQLVAAQKAQKQAQKRAKKKVPKSLSKRIIVKNSKELPPEAKQLLGEKGEWEAAVWYNPHDEVIEVHINENLSPEKYAEALYHEIPGHLGQRLVFADSPALLNTMRQMYGAAKARGDIALKGIEKAYKTDIERAGAQGDDLLFEEWTAHNLHRYLNENDTASLPTRIYNLFRSALVKIGVVKQNVDDVLRSMVKKMRKAKDAGIIESAIKGSFMRPTEEEQSGIEDIRKLLDEYEEGGNLTEQDVYERAKTIAEDSSLPELNDAIETYEEELRYDRELKGRGDMDSANDALMAALNKIITEEENQTKTKAFKRWFGDWENDPKNASKVVDENGEPLVVYHGTSKTFNQANEGPIWWTKNKKQAQNIAEFRTATKQARKEEGKSDVLSAYLNIKKPYKYYSTKEKVPVDEVMETIDREKYDGLIVDNFHYVTFDPNQIKSATGNRGTFSPENPDIRFKRPIYDIESAKAIAQEYGLEFSGSEPSAGGPSYLFTHRKSGTQFRAKTREEVGQAVGAIADRVAPRGTVKAGEGIRFKKPVVEEKPELPQPEPREKMTEPGIVDLTVNDETKGEAFRRVVTDRYYRLRRLMDVAEKKTGTPLPDELNAYVKQDIIQSKVKARIDKILKGTVDKIADIAQAAKLTVREIDEYLYAKHAPEANRVVAERRPDMVEKGLPASGMTDEEAQKIIAAAEKSGKGKALEQISGMVQKWNRARLDAMVEDGLLSQEQRDSWEKEYEFYVPLKGGLDEEGNVIEGERPRTGKGYSVKGAESRMRSGRYTKAQNILAHLASDTAEKIVRGEKNRVIHSLYDFSEKFKNDLILTEPVVIKKTFNKEKGIFEDRKLSNFEIGLTNKYGTPISFKIDGKPLQMLIKDEPLMRAMTNMGSEHGEIMAQIFQGIATINRYLAITRTQLSLNFIPSNALRDTMTAQLNAIGLNLPKEKQQGLALDILKTVPKALKWAYEGEMGKSTKGADAFNDFVENGGAIEFLGMRDIEDSQKKLEQAINGLRPGVIGAGERVMRGAYDYVTKLNSAVENANRLATYTQLVKRGVSKQQAAYIAKNITVNFNRKGELGSFLNAWALFANAGIQGSVRILKTLRDSPTVRAIAGGIIATSLAHAELMRLFAGDDPEDEKNYYDKISDFTRDTHMVIPWGKLTSKETKAYQRIPLPYGYNVFWAAGQHISRVIHGGIKKIPEESLHLIGAVADAFNPIGGSVDLADPKAIVRNFTPTILQPIAEIAVNQNFMGAPTYQEQKAGYGPQPTYSHSGLKSTPQAIKNFTAWASDITGGGKYREGAFDKLGIFSSPDVINHLVEFATGGTGKVVTDLASLPFEWISNKKIPAKGLPIVQRFYGEINEYKDVKTLYDNLDKGQRIYNQYKDYAKTDKEKAKKLLFQYPAMISMMKKKEGEYINKNLETVKGERIPLNLRVIKPLKAMNEQKKKYDESGNKEGVKRMEKMIVNHAQTWNKRLEKMLEPLPVKEKKNE